MLKYILFDFDGTLVDSGKLVVDIYNELAKRYKYRSIRRQDIDGLRSLSIPDRAKALGVPLFRIPQFASYAKQRYESSVAKLQAIDGVKKAVRRLAEAEQRYRLAILSSNSEANIRTFLHNNGMTEFQHIYSERNLFGKHHTISRFLKKRKAIVRDAVYIGDEHRDIVACQKLGLRIVAVTWGFDSKELLTQSRPDYIVDHPDELADLLARIATASSFR